MTEEQYRQLVRNRRPAHTDALFGSLSEGGLLRAATRSLRRREAVEKVLESVFEPAWLEVTRVVGFERGTLTLGVSEPVVCEQIRRQAPQFQRQLAGRVPGLCRLLVTWTG